MQESVDTNQSLMKSDLKTRMDQHAEAKKHNIELYQEYREKEEGVDYIAGTKDPRLIDEKAMKAQAR